LPLYAVLRSIESKVLGVAVMGAIILSVALIPLYDNLKIDNPNARTITKIIF
jgi:quinol-cytochrome oxidoreductase complex cytochrome b subunit